MRIQSNLFQFWYLTYNNYMENTGIQNNEYQTILKVKKNRQKSNNIQYSWTSQGRKLYS